LLGGLCSGLLGNAAAQDNKGPQKPTARLPQIYVRARVRAAFDAFDRDHNNWLSFREMRAALEMDRREYVVVDVDTDGMVTFDEFDRHMQRLIENGAVIRWPTGLVESRPAILDAVVGAESRAATSQPFSFDAPAPKDAKTTASKPAPHRKP
jgi:hypothetical protein